MSTKLQSIGRWATAAVLALLVASPAQAAPTKDNPLRTNKVTPQQRQEAAARAAAKGFVPPLATLGSMDALMLAAPVDATAPMADPTSPPHYFSVPNYANSPLPLPYGNVLAARANPTDLATNVLVVNPTPLPAGNLAAIKTYNMPGSGPNEFHAYVLRPAGAGQYTVVYDTGALAVPAVDAAQEQLFMVGPFDVQEGDLFAHYGQGVPLDIGGGSDRTLYPAGTLPTVGATVDESTTYPLFSTDRTYSIQALVGGMRKFVDELPGLCDPSKTNPCPANKLGQFIPIAVPDTETYPGSDYYEIAVVEYSQQMHSDLPATKLRGYVQLGGSVPLVGANGAEIRLPSGAQAMGRTKPQYLGPFIIATKDKPVRILFRNLLPTGVGGDLFIPVDTTVMGSGMGPNMMGMPDADPRNPMCGQLMRDANGMRMPKNPDCFAENRATLHLHGGISPWISDGTPHQWITPAGENTEYPKGVSVVNVPDMPDPGPGAMTFFYTNQQSARLMFYHDHAWGITRLNVYAGEAAGYVITDAKEQELIGNSVIPGPEATIALVVQDKTFVPTTPQLAAQDPLWDLDRWGGFGQLWVPHVYVPAQNPGDVSGVNQFGRWAYGPWFWPPTSNIDYPPIKNAYYDPNCDPAQGWCEPELMPGTPYLSMGMESFNDTPVVNGTAYPVLNIDPKTYRIRILNAANDRFFNLQLYEADASGTDVALNPLEVAAAKDDPPGVFPTPVAPAGPSWIQIGTEGGFLPSPVLIPPQPITWVTDPTVFNAGNVDKHSLLLGPAERADVIVDFSAYAGKTLILYNDAPAAFPARDPRYDYYTDNADLTSTGGAPPTLPGYGPNTRTVMKIVVANTTPAAPFVQATLKAAFDHHLDANNQPAGVFESSQNPIVVGQGAYNGAYGTNFPASGTLAGFVQIYDEALTFWTLGGTKLTMPLERKAIQDEMGEAFEKEYGRMSGNLGVEAPNAQAGQQQNLILYPYVNPASEVLTGITLPPGVDVTPISSTTEGTQLWKITHNGVDTHPIHFHLFDVQLLNRVGWDGIIRAPDLNEIGWKDTVRISPLEDTIVAARPLIPKLPWALRDSVRPLNPMMPIGNADMFNSTDAFGNPITPAITNQVVNFGWEYVWHCHILSHEEMDMMRPISVLVGAVLPPPSILTVAPTTPTATQTPIVLTWTDGTPVTSDIITWGDPANEFEFRVERASVGRNGRLGTYSVLATLAPNTTTYTDTTAAAGTTYSYRVAAVNKAGQSYSLPAGGATETAPAAPTQVTAVLQTGPSVVVTWRDNATNEAYFTIERQQDGGTWVRIATPPARANTGTASYTDTTITPQHWYAYRVSAVNSAGTSTSLPTAALEVPLPPSAPTLTSGTAVVSGKKANVTVAWTNVANETGYEIQRATNAGFSVGVNNSTVGADVTTVTQTGLYRGVPYYYRVRAVNLGGTSAWSNVFTVITP